MAGGKFIIEQSGVELLDLRLGEYGYLKQGDAMVLIDPGSALELSDKLAAWAVAHLQATQGEVG
jgi:hypothetical protein